MNAFQRVETGIRLVLPVLFTAILALASVLPLPIPGFAPVSPMMVLGSIYFWAIYRPQVMPLVAVFLLGGFEDILTGAPLGVSSFAYLACFALVAGQRRFFLGKSFGVIWWGFMLVAASVEALRWLLVSVMNGVILDPTPGFFAYVTSIALYPILTLLFIATQNILPQPSEPA